MEEVDGLNTLAEFSGIHNFQTACFKPLCGMFMQSKYLPLADAP